MRSVASGGETLGAELLDWGRKVLGVTINEFYGQTECNMIVSSCAAVMEAVPGVMGQPVPGHEVEVIDDRGQPVRQGQTGMIAVKRPDPVMFLSYWANEEATRGKFISDWLLTGDQGAREPDGRIRFIGRDDDIINSAGYRIGPGEIEDCLMRHPAVEMAAAVGKPDAARGEIVKAYVVQRKQGDFGDFRHLALDLEGFPFKAARALNDFSNGGESEWQVVTTGQEKQKQKAEDEAGAAAHGKFLSAGRGDLQPPGCRSAPESEATICSAPCPCQGVPLCPFLPASTAARGIWPLASGNACIPCRGSRGF
jgi:acyl-CoA synthetase (AMP-forming)/AMP-acid ligase II